MRVLITGGAGFIGSALGQRLCERGDEVIVVDNLSRGSRALVPKAASLIVRDVLRDDMAALVQRTEPAAIVHLAAQIHVRQSSEAPDIDAEQNVLGTLRLLEAARQAGVETFVFASSGGAVYGNDVARPTPEAASCAPLSPYGVSKLAAELYCALYARNSGMRSVILRLANVYGPNQSTAGESGVIALFLAALRAKQTPVLIGTGSQTRDYVFIDDVVDAFARALDRRNARGIYNVGSGHATSVQDILFALANILGASAHHETRAARAFEVAHSCLDAQRAKDELGWQPRTELGDGLRRTAGVFAPALTPAPARPSRRSAAQPIEHRA